MADQVAQASGITREEALRAQGGKTVLGRFGEPEEIANVIVFLCSALASNVLGAAWSVDGGNFASII
jgi:NAD(P)-dependent dehydrogenase (short-subunit alcohol dehydrogenase family)